MTGCKDFDFLPRKAVKTTGQTNWYYNVERLEPYDLVMAAGGEEKYKLPFRGQVMNFDRQQGVLELEPVDSFFFSERVARRQLIRVLCAVLKDQDIDNETIKQRVWGMTINEFLELTDTVTSSLVKQQAHSV